MNTLRDSPQDPPASAVLRDSGPASVGQDAYLPWWHRITIPFEVLIATVVVTAMLLLTALLVYQVSTSARQAIISASDESAQRISQLIAERVHRIVDPADATIRLLAFDPVASAPTLPARLRRLPVLARLLEQNQLLSAVFIGYPDGQFLLVRPVRNDALRVQLDAPPKTAYLVQSMAREHGVASMVGRWSYYGADLRLISSAVRSEYRYDPRTRPWYAEALERNTQILTAPYVFFTTQEVGITLSQPSEDGRAVIGLDVALTDLGHEISGLRLMPRTEIAVVDKDLRVLAYPDMSRVIMRDGAASSLRLRTLGDLGVSSLQAMQGPGLQSGKSQRLVADGEEWLTRALPLESMR